MPTNDDTPRIYVACLACYNDGKLHGVWVDAIDADEIETARLALQTECGHLDNDWAIHDYEGFCGIKLGESESFTDVAELARLLEEHGPAYAAYVENVGAKYATEDGFRDAYQGEFDSAEAYAEELVAELYDLKALGNLANYIDYEAFARDLGFDGYTFSRAPSGGVFVFAP
jgi:antirestriction protein